MGYLAPEQALGKPSLRSDVFSLGLILYRMLSGKLPEWPFTWPPPSYAKVRRLAPPDLVALIQRALAVDQAKRFPSAVQMLAAFRKVRPKTLARDARRRHHRRRRQQKGRDLEAIRLTLFQRRFRSALDTRSRCRRCRGPVSEPMQACPWCGVARRVHDGASRFPSRCPRCKRGRKLDWRFCA